ncbi:hypothetical protein QQF64_012949 [Cirrhinus molitorella]|uniref:Uncharacterized protein n=1 Tax=Cirrhinus molitorella TaxID=172907 RepID=A0ABR3LPQ4_9TELE
MVNRCAGALAVEHGPAAKHYPNEVGGKEPQGQTIDFTVVDHCLCQEVLHYGLTMMERVLTFGGVGLTVFVCFLAIVVAGRNIYNRRMDRS